MMFRPNIARVVAVNGKKIPIDSLPILLPMGGINGSYNAIADLTEIVKKDDFQSVDILINDPIFGEYTSEKDGMFYTYTRNSEVEISKAFVSIIGTDSISVGKVTDLPDTTIILNDFYSHQVGNVLERRLTVEEMHYGLHIKTVKTILARKLITISKADFMRPIELTNQLDTLVVYQDSIATYKFQVKHQDSSPLHYSLSQNEGGSINSSGVFTFSGIYDGTIDEKEYSHFVVNISTENYTCRDTFVVEFRARITSIKDRHKPNFNFVSYPNPINDKVTFEFNLPTSGMINIEVCNLSGQLIEMLVSDYFQSGLNRISFNSSNLKAGIYLCRLRDESNLVQTIKIIK